LYQRLSNNQSIRTVQERTHSIPAVRSVRSLWREKITVKKKRKHNITNRTKVKEYRLARKNKSSSFKLSYRLALVSFSLTAFYHIFSTFLFVLVIQHLRATSLFNKFKGIHSVKRKSLYNKIDILVLAAKASRTSVATANISWPIWKHLLALRLIRALLLRGTLYYSAADFTSTLTNLVNVFNWAFEWIQSLLINLKYKKALTRTIVVISAIIWRKLAC